MLSFNLNFYETSSGNVVKQAFGMLYSVSGTSIIRVCIQMTTYIILRDFLSSPSGSWMSCLRIYLTSGIKVIHNDYTTLKTTWLVMW